MMGGEHSFKQQLFPSLAQLSDGGQAVGRVPSLTVSMMVGTRWCRCIQGVPASDSNISG